MNLQVIEEIAKWKSSAFNVNDGSRGKRWNPNIKWFDIRKQKVIIENASSTGNRITRSLAKHP